MDAVLTVKNNGRVTTSTPTRIKKVYNEAVSMACFRLLRPFRFRIRRGCAIGPSLVVSPLADWPDFDTLCETAMNAEYTVKSTTFKEGKTITRYRRFISASIYLNRRKRTLVRTFHNKRYTTEKLPRKVRGLKRTLYPIGFSH